MYIHSHYLYIIRDNRSCFFYETWWVFDAYIAGSLSFGTIVIFIFLFTLLGIEFNSYLVVYLVNLGFWINGVCIVLLEGDVCGGFLTIKLVFLLWEGCFVLYPFVFSQKDGIFN